VYGGTFTNDGVPIFIVLDCEDKDGGDFPLSDPPVLVVTDFSGMDFDPNDPSSSFAMPPADWDYDYPVLQWQIHELIQP
jgi:hypothetical protein